VDRAALPPPEGQRPGLTRPFIAPRTPVEEALAAIWVDVLGVERAGIDDDFFDLGGHSLLATRIVARAASRFEVALPLSVLLEEPTIRELAATITERLMAQPPAAPTHPGGPGGRSAGDPTH
jgi:acyl carrier protein